MAEKKQRILVIDDEEVTLSILSKILRNLEYEVLATSNSLKGVEMALSEKPDLILLDIYMPYRNGWSVLAQIRSDSALGNTPVVILTSEKDTQSVELAHEMGISSYLNKPVNAEQLKAKVKEAIGQS